MWALLCVSLAWADDAPPSPSLPEALPEPPARLEAMAWKPLALVSVGMLALGAATMVSSYGFDEGSPQRVDRLWSGAFIGGAGLLVGVSVPIILDGEDRRASRGP